MIKSNKHTATDRKLSSSSRRTLIQAVSLGSGVALGSLAVQRQANASKDNTIIVGTTHRPPHLNSAVLAGVTTLLPTAQLYATPLRIDADWRIRPYLAKSWQVSDDGLRIHLSLHQRARFHDGEAITAEDLRYSIEVIKAWHPMRDILEPVIGVEVENRYTAIIHLRRPHPALLMALSSALMPVIPKHVFDDGQDIRQHPRNASPVGSGPFVLKEFSAKKNIVLLRNNDFFMPNSPKVERIIYREFKRPSNLMGALARGEIDIHVQLSSAADVQRARKMPNVYIQKEAAPAIGPIVWLAFNTAHNKLADKRVRQAINFAIDKNDIVANLLGNVHRRATGPIHSASPFYTNRVERYELNIKRAQRLLQQAGFPVDENGFRFELIIDSLPGVSQMQSVQSYLVLALRQVGIRVRTRHSSGFQAWSARIANHQFEATIDSVWNWGDPGIGVHRSWHSNNIRKGTIWSNTQSYRNAKVDELIAIAGSEDNTDRRTQAYHQMQKIVTDDCPVAFLYELGLHYALNKKISAPPNSVWGMASPILETFVKPLA